ncbi:MAG: hypothetical protein GF416_03050 [Candidatus Altiarchaeales archaeon]|nr:hypothetical protein [Candidatus Altiarchaeales archaeon]MBD3416098.1 hypothetical protein [Candidatus Altiarchaeales archaeon]
MNPVEAVNQGVFGFLIALGIYLVYLNFKTLFRPQRTGVILSLGLEGVKACSVNGCMSCSTGDQSGKASLPLKVELEDGSVVSAETSPCNICIDKLSVGSRVGLTEIGSRTIANRVGKVRF